MQRALIHEAAASENVPPALLQFESEAISSPATAAPADEGTAPAFTSSPLPDSWATESFHSETLEPFDFDSEASDSSAASGADRRRRRETTPLFVGVSAGRSSNWSRVTMVAAAVAVLVALGLPASRWLLAPPVQAKTSMTGVLVVVTNPPGLIVVIDGTPSGITPLHQKLIAGPHTVELRGAGPSRTIAVTVTAGGRAFQYLELPEALSDVGHLDPRSDPPAADVTTDGATIVSAPAVVR